MAGGARSSARCGNSPKISLGLVQVCLGAIPASHVLSRKKISEAPDQTEYIQFQFQQLMKESGVGKGVSCKGTSH